MGSKLIMFPDCVFMNHSSSTCTVPTSKGRYYIDGIRDNNQFNTTIEATSSTSSPSLQIGHVENLNIPRHLQPLYDLGYFNKKTYDIHDIINFEEETIS